MAKKNKCEGKPAAVYDVVDGQDFLVATYCCEKHAKEAASDEQVVVAA